MIPNHATHHIWIKTYFLICSNAYDDVINFEVSRYIKHKNQNILRTKHNFFFKLNLIPCIFQAILWQNLYGRNFSNQTWICWHIHQASNLTFLDMIWSLYRNPTFTDITEIVSFVRLRICYLIAIMEDVRIFFKFVQKRLNLKMNSKWVLNISIKMSTEAFKNMLKASLDIWSHFWYYGWSIQFPVISGAS